MRYRPVKKPAPMPENPYHRIFTPMPSFEDLVRKAREEEKTKKKLEISNYARAEMPAVYSYTEFTNC